MNEHPQYKSWPVDPARYPLRGPTRGPVATPSRPVTYPPPLISRALIKLAIWFDR